MAQQPDHCSVTWERRTQRDGRQLSREVHDWNCSHGKIQSSTLTELFKFALSPPSGRAEPPSLQLLTGNRVQPLLPYRELFGEGRKTPTLQTICVNLHSHSREDFQEGEGRLFWTGVFRQSPFAQFHSVPMHQILACSGCARGMRMSELHSLRAGGTRVSYQR